MEINQKEKGKEIIKKDAGTAESQDTKHGNAGQKEKEQEKGRAEKQKIGKEGKQKEKAKEKGIATDAENQDIRHGNAKQQQAKLEINMNPQDGEEKQKTGQVDSSVMKWK